MAGLCFGDLFAAGTITFLPPDIAQVADWSPIYTALADQPFHVLTAFQPRESHGLIQSLSWLISKHFIRLQYLATRDLLYLRVYMIPEDIGCMSSELYSRHHHVKEGSRTVAIKHLRAVLARVNRSTSAWNGNSAGILNGDFLSEQLDQRTLSELYQSLHSPQPHHSGEVSDEASLYSLALSSYSDSLNTELHAYQHSTVATMLERECPYIYSPLPPGHAGEALPVVQSAHTSPLFLPMDTVSSPGIKFFIQPSKLTVRQQPPTFEMIRGGILCEEMGTGKTLICIALILATLDHLSQPRLSKDDEPICTNLSLSNFGSGSEVIEVPSLRELCYYKIRTCPHSVPWRQLEQAFPDHMWDEITDPDRRPFYYPALGLNHSSIRDEPKRRIVETLATKTWLTNATLVIVPAILLEQWRTEIGKHVKEGSLRWHVIDAKATELPAAETMTEHWDMVLISQERLINERKKSSDLPFGNLHWLRIIVDEGNVCANKSNVMAYVGGLKADRRWIVTGTPTTNLITVDTDTSTTSLDSEPNSLEIPALIGKPKSALFQCKEDLIKLSSMICGFLGASMPSMIGGFLQSFPVMMDDEALFRSFIISPSLEGSWGGTQVLENVMSQFLVRHRIEDIEREITLPPKTRQTVLLDMDPFQAITYNVMLSLVVVNAVDSERTDKDYFFHPDNQKFRAVLILNLSQTCLWRAEKELDSTLDEWVKVSANSVEKATMLAEKREGFEEDLKLVKHAHNIQQDAYSQTVWRSMMRHEQLPFRILSFPPALREYWLRIRMPKESTKHQSKQTQESVCFLTNISDFRLAGQDCRLSIESMKYEGDIRQQRGMRLGRRTESTRFSSVSVSPRRVSGSPKKTSRLRTSPRSVTSAGSGFTGSPSKSTRSTVGTQRGVPSKASDSPSKDAQSISRLHDVGRVMNPIYSDNPLLSTRIGGSTSPKVNYIVSQLLLHINDKFLIFSDSPLSLDYIRDALQVARIPSLSLYGRSARDCEALVQLFETDGTYRALLLLLEQGARGLNLTSANRVIFTEPVWRADVEAQAIKRVHRIGQQRPVDITVLAMRGSFEEEMLRRGPNHEKLMENDEVMMNFLKNPKFIETPPADKRAESLIDLPMFDVPNIIERPAIRKKVTFLLSPEPTPEPEVSPESSKLKLTSSNYPSPSSPSHMATLLAGGSYKPKFTIRIPPVQKRKIVEDRPPSAADSRENVKRRKITLGDPE